MPNAIGCKVGASPNGQHAICTARGIGVQRSNACMRVGERATTIHAWFGRLRSSL